jgi:hypothetical protein
MEHVIAVEHTRYQACDTLECTKHLVDGDLHSISHLGQDMV